MMGRVFKIATVAVLLIAADMFFEVSFPAVREVNLSTSKLDKAETITLLQISDFHGSTSRYMTRRLISEAARIKPDAILITGDLVDSKTVEFGNVYALIESLGSVCPNVFIVFGNHERNNARRAELTERLKALGVTLLDNKSTSISIRGSHINICGVGDPYSRRDKIEKAMKGVDTKKYTVLLSHSPRIRDRLQHYNPDLILCGHTHGGQVRLPFIGALIAPGEGVFPKFDKGLFKLENGSILYIDSGVGTSELPIRLFNRSQISVIRIAGK